MLRSAGHHTQEHFFHSWICGSALTVQQGSGRCAERDKPVKHWREEMLKEAALNASDSLVRGPERGKWMVLVLDKQKKPLMPCTPKRARLLLARGRAVVHRVKPFVIRLRDRRVEESTLQEGRLKLDPGSKTTGLALVRVEQTPEGEVHHAVLLAEVQHRGEQVHQNKITQRQARRRRRNANLRHRAPRFTNRGRPCGWLPPSLLSRVGNLLTWTKRLSRWFPLQGIEVEHVRFDTQLLQNLEISGKEYQEGTLAGWEARAYLLLKYEYRCVYCGKQDGPFELDHLRPRSRGGSNRISNLALSCHDCNLAKGNLTAAEFGHPEVEAAAMHPLKDAAAVNATRYKVVQTLQELGLPIGTWSGGRTRWNRARFGLEKTHALDALCVGDLAGVKPGELKTVRIKASGRGQHCRTLWTKHGFPRAHLMRRKMVAGFITGDVVKAVVPPPLKTAGMHVGRISVRATGSCAIRTSKGTIDGINVRYLHLIQRSDGYEYLSAEQPGGNLSAPCPTGPKAAPASSPS
jgi:5-methylcytosine-specific restriction endonuclease McrA